MKCDHSNARYAGEQREGKYVYCCPDCKTELLLEHAVEGISEAPTPVAQEVCCKAPTSAPAPDAEKKKSQSDYHKRRYQLMKTGQWTGTLKQ